MITANDIVEKRFSKDRKDGYNMDEVDAFLDEVARDYVALQKENRILREKLTAAEAAAQEVPQTHSAYIQESPKAEEKLDFNESGYLKNLEATLRETLISAQRIADSTVADAQKQAGQLLSNAEEQARGIISSSKIEAEATRNELSELKAAAQDYRTKFITLVEEQAGLLSLSEDIFN